MPNLAAPKAEKVVVDLVEESPKGTSSERPHKQGLAVPEAPSTNDGSWGGVPDDLA